MTKMRIKIVHGGRPLWHRFRVTCNGPLCGRYGETTYFIKTAFSCAFRHFESYHPAEWLGYVNAVRNRESQALREKLDAEARLLGLRDDVDAVLRQNGF